MTQPPTPAELGHDLLDLPAVHAQYGLPLRTIRHLIYLPGDSLPVVRLGRRVFVRRADLLAYLAAHTVEAGQ